MAAGNTYEAIATQTLGSNTTVTFTSIPQTYTDLVLVVNGLSTVDQGAEYQVGNGSVDTGSNYSRTRIMGDGSSASSFRASNQDRFLCDGFSTSSSYASMQIVHFMNYSNTTTNKTVLFRGSSTQAYILAQVGLWRSTSAINTIKVAGYNGNLTSGTTVSLYGIKAA
jgi:hypothetical protein